MTTSSEAIFTFTRVTFMSTLLSRGAGPMPASFGSVKTSPVGSSMPTRPTDRDVPCAAPGLGVAQPAVPCGVADELHAIAKSQLLHCL